MFVKFTYAVAAVAVFAACSSEAWADTVPARNVVLVHGAWADGSS